MLAACHYLRSSNNAVIVHPSKIGLPLPSMSFDILDFLEPVEQSKLSAEFSRQEGRWHNAVRVNSGGRIDLDGRQIVLIGITDTDNGEQASYAIRNQLYALSKVELAENVADLGNYRTDYSIKSLQQLGFLLSELIASNIVPVILNGRQQLTYAQYLAYHYTRKYCHLVLLDPKLDFNLKDDEPLGPTTYLQHILTQEPSFLFSLTGIGLQGHHVDTTMQSFLEKLFFDFHRLGDVRANLTDAEPAIRGANLLSMDMSVIRGGDMPSAFEGGPHGFFGEEACALLRYAGMSSTLKCLGMYEYQWESDLKTQGAQLIAQLIWYFADGYLLRYNEHPQENREEFLQYITTMSSNRQEIVFYKSKRTDRWWMEIPMNEEEFAGSRHILPCSYADYLTATRAEIPDRWWWAMHKLN